VGCVVAVRRAAGCRITCSCLAGCPSSSSCLRVSGLGTATTATATGPAARATRLAGAVTARAATKACPATGWCGLGSPGRAQTDASGRWDSYSAARSPAARRATPCIGTGIVAVTSRAVGKACTRSCSTVEWPTAGRWSFHVRAPGSTKNKHVGNTHFWTTCSCAALGAGAARTSAECDCTNRCGEWSITHCRASPAPSLWCTTAIATRTCTKADHMARTRRLGHAAGQHDERGTNNMSAAWTAVSWRAAAPAARACPTANCTSGPCCLDHTAVPNGSTWGTDHSRGSRFNTICCTVLTATESCATGSCTAKLCIRSCATRCTGMRCTDCPEATCNRARRSPAAVTAWSPPVSHRRANANLPEAAGTAAPSAGGAATVATWGPASGTHRAARASACTWSGRGSPKAAVARVLNPHLSANHPS